MGRIVNNVWPSRYARALTELAADRGPAYMDALHAQAGNLLDVFSSDAEFAALMANPRLSAQEKGGVLRKAFGEGLAEEIYGLLDLLFRKARASGITAVLERFRALVREQKRVAAAEISSAVPLTAQQTENIRKTLEKKLNKQVEVSVKIDPSLIGGLRVTADGMAADATVKNRIDGLKRQLLRTRSV